MKNVTDEVKRHMFGSTRILLGCYYYEYQSISDILEHPLTIPEQDPTRFPITKFSLFGICNFNTRGQRIKRSWYTMIDVTGTLEGIAIDPKERTILDTHPIISSFYFRENYILLPDKSIGSCYPQYSSEQSNVRIPILFGIRPERGNNRDNSIHPITPDTVPEEWDIFLKELVHA